MHGKRCESRLFAFGRWDAPIRNELDAADRILAANMKRQGRALVDAASEPARPVRDEMDGHATEVFLLFWTE